MSTGAAELLQDTGGVITDQAAETPQEIAARSPFALFWRRLRQDKVALVAGAAPATDPRSYSSRERLARTIRTLIDDLQWKISLKYPPSAEAADRAR